MPWALAVLMITTPPGVSLAQAPAQPANTRVLVQVTQLKPGRAAEWRALQQNEVLPALKKAGVTSRDTLETLFGDTNEYVTLRPLDNSRNSTARACCSACWVPGPGTP